MARYTCLYCSASFLSNDLLARHLEEYRLSGRTPDVLLRDAHGRNHSREASSFGSTPGYVNLPFLSYVRAYVPCEEVCVICFKVFRWTSEYIRHAREHPNPSQTKRQYTEKICSELRGQSNRELEKALKKSMGGHMEPILGKRTWGAASLETDSAKDCREPNNDANGWYTNAPPDLEYSTTV
ncbi:unnamed protein product [Clonostachys rhizophaga]|uniref:C2H2-type domain-containing protein n=1 Tax=Clonostachys rhizophaga TaxID=160324 RepID=A0A9N9VBJ8_9HYPO|nr:unnamed protein product [Clonostachys rhizophaga]